MGFLDQLSKTITQGVDRAKFEADKFQKTSRLQGEVSEVKRQLDEKMVELGQRAYDLHRAGQINAPSIAELTRTIDALRSELVTKEEVLKQAQVDDFVEPVGAQPGAQSVPISYDTPAPTPNPTPNIAGATMKNCASCGFQMPQTAMFCPNCGARSVS